MCASKMTGYQGFKSSAVQQCATLKPGESFEQRATKFSLMGSQTISSLTMNRLGRHAHESVAIQNGQHVQPGHYRVPGRRSVSMNEKRPTLKPFIASSTYLHDFPAFDKVRTNVPHIPLEQYEKAFMVVAQPNNQQQDKRIQLFQVQNVLKLAFGDASIARVNDKFHSFFSGQGNERDWISWETFSQAVCHVNSLFDRELSHGKLPEPSSKLLSKLKLTEKQGNEFCMHFSTPASSHHIDYGTYGDNPRDRPYMRKQGMASTTTDLSSEAIDRIPGYGGFLPRSLHNTRFETHTNDQDQCSTLRGALRINHSENVPGYTGHKPVDCVNYQGECRAGSDFRTTTGNSYKGHK